MRQAPAPNSDVQINLSLKTEYFDYNYTIIKPLKTLKI